MAIDVRAIREDELLTWLDAQTTAFLVRPDIEKIADEVREHWDLSRVWGAFDGERAVGTLRTYGTELTVPGNAQIKASAVTQVAVRPTHRRRGLLRRMISAEHTASRERGEVASLLYASEGSIYRRFGYGIGCQTAAWTIDLTASGFHDAAGGRSGSVEMLDVDEASIEVVRGVFERARRRQPGEIWRRPITWKSDFGLAGRSWGDGWKGFLAVHRAEDGTPDGYARYHAEQKWEARQPRSVLTVDDLHADTPDTTVALLRFLADVDLVTKLRLESRAPSERFPWLLTNARAAVADEVGDGLWVRLHDIPAALEARTYERSGSVVLEVVGTGPDSDGRTRVALEAGPDGARATETGRDPDLTVHAGALGAAYLGGSRLADAVLAMGVEEHRPGALAEADALFVCRDAPRCSTWF